MCKRSDSITELAKALVKFNGEVSKIDKDSTNPHFKNKYASLDNIIDEVRPILTKNGLAIIQMPGGDGEKFTMTTMLVHESGEWIESEPIVMRPVKNDPQGIGSCATYARRYSLAAFLSLNTGDDDDGNNASQPQGAQKTSQGAQKQTNFNSQESQNADLAAIEADSQKNAGRQTQPNSTATPNANLLTENQAKYADRLKKEKHVTDEDFRRMVAELSEGNMDVYQMTKKQAGDLINLLTNLQPATV